MKRRARTLAASLLVLALHASGPAHGDGTIGLTHNLQFGLHYGSLNNEVIGVIGADEGSAGFSSDGYASLLRFRGGDYMELTHYGNQVGAEILLGIGWIEAAALAAADPTWGRLYLDMDTNLLIDVVRAGGNRSLPRLRLSFVGGFGLSTDFSSLFMGTRGVTRLGSVQLEFEYQRRWGASHSAPSLREERIHFYAFRKQFGLGFEVWRGYSEDANGLAADDRVFRGGFEATTVNLMWVPK